jgi:hypothetical protein
MSNTFNIKRTETNGDGVALNSVAHPRPTSKIDVIIDALSVAQNSVWSALNEQALAAARELQAEKQKPVAWMVLTQDDKKLMLYGEEKPPIFNTPVKLISLYAAPPKSDNELDAIDKSIHEEIERLKTEIKRLKELAEYRLKLLMKMPEQADQKPVAWIGEGGKLLSFKNVPMPKNIPVYAAPPRKEWVGLTDDEIKEVLDLNVAPWSLSGDSLQHVMGDARALEAKIKEKNGA